MDDPLYKIGRADGLREAEATYTVMLLTILEHLHMDEIKLTPRDAMRVNPTDRLVRFVNQDTGTFTIRRRRGPQ